MKKSVILIIFLCICKQTLFSQNNVGEITFCHTSNQQLYCCTENNYILQFDKQKLKCFYTKDSSIYYDVSKKYFQIKKANRVIITTQLQNEGNIIVQDKRNDSIYERKTLKESSACESEANNFENIYNDSTMITFVYTYCRLIAVTIVDVDLGSINLFVYQCPGKNIFSWDLTFRPVGKNNSQGKCLKILSDRKYGEPDFISICNDIKMEHYKTDPGVEIISQPKKTNQFYKVRNVTEAKLFGSFNYEDMIVYDKKGKVKTSKIPIKECTCK